MIISSIKKRRSDVELVFDDDSKIHVDYRVVFDNGLRKNDEITKEFCEKLSIETGKLKIKDSAFRLLSRRQHSKFELTQKLIRRGYSKEEIEPVLFQIEEKGLLDDIQFTKAYLVERLAKKKVGINKIKAELLKKGIDQKIIEKILSRVDISESELTALTLSQKKLTALKRKESDPRKIQQKLAAFLFAKGFETDLIRNVLGKLNLEKDAFEDL
jgi:regulatory protein